MKVYISSIIYRVIKRIQRQRSIQIYHLRLKHSPKLLLCELSNLKHFRFEATFTPRVPTSAPSIIITLPIPLSMLYTGITDRFVYYNRTSFCNYCNATGATQGDLVFLSLFHHSQQCPYCNGTGLREYIHLSESNTEGLSFKSRCDVCNGSGHIHNPSDSCPYCRGTGIRIVRDYVDVATDPGIRSGTELTFRRMVSSIYCI